VRPAIILAMTIIGATFVGRERPAFAEENGERIRLDYAGAESCPSKQAFEGLVRGRTSRALFVSDDGDGRVFDVRLTAGTSPKGRVVVRRGGVFEGTRDVRAETCADVADALALVVALAIDPMARTKPLASPPEPEPPPPSPRSAEPEPIAPPVTTTETPVAPSVVERRSRGAFSLGTDVAIVTGAAPTTLLGVSPVVAGKWPIGSMAIGAHLGFVHARTGEVSVPGGAAAFTWNVGQLDGCLTPWPAARARLSACARVQGGVLDASGLAIPSPKSESRAWLATGPLLRAEWSIVGPLFVDANLGMMFHVMVDRFYFLPDTTAYRVPLVGLDGAIGAGVTFL